MRLAETLAGCIRDRRNQAQVVHLLSARLRIRMLAIARRYEDADDCDVLRADALFKLASGKAPESGGKLFISRPCAAWRTRRLASRWRG